MTTRFSPCRVDASTIANGGVFGENIGNLPVIVTFTTPRAFTLTSAAATGRLVEWHGELWIGGLLYFDRHGRRREPLRLNL